MLCAPYAVRSVPPIDNIATGVLVPQESADLGKTDRRAAQAARLKVRSVNCRRRQSSETIFSDAPVKLNAAQW